MRRYLLLLAVGGLFAGCAHGPVLVPAPNVPIEPGTQNVVRAESAGVRIAIDTSPWHGSPGDLGEVVTPVKVILENRSGAALAIRYDEFGLRSSTGFFARALPPFTVQRPGYAVGGPWGPYYYPWLSPWGGPFVYDPFYYDWYYSYWQDPLPSKDMMERALPEGVLEAAGTVSGYLYFQRVRRDLGEVQFVAELRDAHTNASQGTIFIPLLVK